MKKILYMHIGMMGKYQEIFSEMFEALIHSGLVEHLDRLYLMHYGDADINMLQPLYDFIHQQPADKICVMRGPLVEPTSEFITLTHMKALANQMERDGEKAFIGYVHTKGTLHPDTGGLNAVTDWRRYMQHFVIERHLDVFKLLNDHDTVGVDLRRNPGLHYSGNFWWTRSDYLASLPELMEAEIDGMPSPRHRAEFYIASNLAARHLSMWDSGIGVYERGMHEYPPERYRHGVIMARWQGSSLALSET
jgi:hypothetical protein